MTADIGARIGVDGEKEFKSALAAINSEMKALDSSMKLVQEEFADMADSEEAAAAKGDVLARSVETQERKIALLTNEYDRANTKLSDLANALDEAKQKSGENSVEATKAQNAYNRQVKAVKDLERQLNDAKTVMTKTEREMRDLSKEADDLTDNINTAGKGFADFGSKVKGAFVGGAVLGAVSSLAGSIADLSEQSLEYNKIMGTLDVSGQKAGYTAEETKESFYQLQGVLGDQQAAATALANLQALGLEQDKLKQITEGAIGAALSYGDAINPEELAQSINETISAGVVTGQFADMLVLAGKSEDEFNKKLAATTKKSERVQLILDEMAQQNLPGVTAAWREENAAIVEANLSTERLADATAQFGAIFTPVVTGAKNLAADFLLGIVDIVEFLPNLANAAKEAFKKVGDAIQDYGEAQIKAATNDMAATADLNYLTAGNQNYSYGDINLYIDNVDNGNGRDVETLAQELEFLRRQQASGRGGK